MSDVPLPLLREYELLICPNCSCINGTDNEYCCDCSAILINAERVIHTYKVKDALRKFQEFLKQENGQVVFKITNPRLLHKGETYNLKLDKIINKFDEVFGVLEEKKESDK